MGTPWIAGEEQVQQVTHREPDSVLMSAQIQHMEEGALSGTKYPCSH